MSRSIIQLVQEKLNYKASMDRMIKEEVFLQLVLLNYQPIVRYKDGYKEYLYVNAYDKEGHVYFLHSRSMKRDKNGGYTEQRAGILDDMLSLQARSRNFVEEICAISKNTVQEGSGEPKDGTIIFNSEHGGEAEILFSRRSSELQALMFVTKEFSIFEQAFLRKARIPQLGEYLLPEQMNAKGSMIPTFNWLRSMYITYMFYRNLDLTDYYYTLQVKPNQEHFMQMNRVCTFDEYIPLGYKFSDVYNPLFEDCIDILKSKFKIFAKALHVSPISMVSGISGSISASAASTFALYTTRAEMTQLFRVNTAKINTAELVANGMLLTKIKKHTVNFYSPKYFLTVLFTQFADELGEDFPIISIGLDDPVVYRYKQERWTEDDAYQEFTSATLVYVGPETEYVRSRKSADVQGYIDHTVSWINGLYLEYVLNTFGGVIEDTAWSKTGIRARFDIE